MNKANYTAASKYPLSTQGLAFIQGQILTAQKMCAALGSGKWIIDGCVETNNGGATTVSAGAVVIAGEIVEVPESVKAVTCYIKETANANPNRVVRELAFGTNVNTGENMVWAEFARVDISQLATKAEVEALRDLAMPKGAIIMWAGTVNESDAAFPYGFRLCDGRTIDGYGVLPDLRSRFIVGYDPTSANTAMDYSAIGMTGGEGKHTLTVDEMPSHRHSIIGEMMQKAGSKTQDVVAIDTGNDPNHGTVIFYDKVGYEGGSGAHENRPPYYTLAYLIKVI